MVLFFLFHLHLCRNTDFFFFPPAVFLPPCSFVYGFLKTGFTFCQETHVLDFFPPLFLRSFLLVKMKPSDTLISNGRNLFSVWMKRVFVCCFSDPFLSFLIVVL